MSSTQKLNAQAGPACLPPWRENPYRLVSLWDIMQEFNASGLCEVVRELCKWECISSGHIQANSGQALLSKSLLDGQIKELIKACRSSCQAIELTGPLDRLQSTELIDRLFMYGNADWRTLESEVRNLRESIQIDLERRKFLFVPPDDAKVLRRIAKGYNEHDSWQPIWDKIPNAKEDIHEAVYCYAFGRYTASVFHSMRIAEHCMRVFCKRLRVPLTDKGKRIPVEAATWDRALTACTNKVKAAHRHPAGPRKQAILDRYSEAIDQCMTMKDRWRNPISHAGRPYSQPESLAILDRVRHFGWFVSHHFMK